MTVKHWLAVAHQNGRILRLYVTSTDALIERDLQLPSRASLIESGRQLNGRREITDHSNHHDFATGAFDCYCHNRNIKIDRLDLTDLVPPDLPSVPLGGDERSFLTQVYEEK